VDCRSRLEALSFIPGKPLALQGLLIPQSTRVTYIITLALDLVVATGFILLELVLRLHGDFRRSLEPIRGPPLQAELMLYLHWLNTRNLRKLSSKYASPFYPLLQFYCTSGGRFLE